MPIRSLPCRLVLLSGFDVTEIDEHGQVTRVLGFFGPLPAAD